MGISSISAVVHSLRVDRGLSQNALGDLAGLAPSTVTRLENEEREPRPSTLRLVLQGLAAASPFSALEIDRLTDSTGLPPRELEAINRAAERAREASEFVASGGDAGVELAAIERLLGPEQALLFLRAFRACLQQAEHTGAERAFESLGLTDVPGETEEEVESNAKRLYEATKLLGGERGPGEGRVIRVALPPRKGDIPGTVVQEYRVYEEVPDPSTDTPASDSMPPKEAP